MIKIISDSSSDVRKLSSVAYQCAPLTISTDEISFRDDEQLDIDAMLEVLAEHKGRSYTACPNVEDWLGAFEGADTVYVLTLTRNLSGAYNSACAAKELYLQSNPEAKVVVFDTLTTAAELRLLVEKLEQLIAAGHEFEDVCRSMENYMTRTRLFFSLQSLHNLAQNGRVSKVVAATVGVLGIRIVGTASPEGTLSPISKSRGDSKAMAELVHQLELAGYEGGKLRISHVQNEKLANDFAARVRQRYPNADILCYPAGGLCSYYAERGAILIGVETE